MRRGPGERGAGGGAAFMGLVVFANRLTEISDYTTDKTQTRQVIE